MVKYKVQVVRVHTGAAAEMTFYNPTNYRSIAELNEAA